MGKSSELACTEDKVPLTIPPIEMEMREVKTDTLAQVVASEGWIYIILPSYHNVGRHAKTRRDVCFFYQPHLPKTA
jgi:hypothetical protein